MPYKLKNMNLTWNSLYVSYVYNSIFFENLYSNFLFCEDMSCQFNLTECAFTDGFALNKIISTKNVVSYGFATRWIKFEC